MSNCSSKTIGEPTEILTSPLAVNRIQLQSLTSLRFFAAIYVVIYHYWNSYHLSNVRPILVELGETGVTFFFLLSGFILSYSYDGGGGTFS
jgi:peptidoglycan/LPS O-acetylase OafA/YrhL